MKNYLDLSCIHADSHLPSGELRRTLPDTVISFENMILERLISGREDASDECLGIGRSYHECVYRLLQEAGHGLHMTLNADPGDVEKNVRSRLRQYAMSNWLTSHHLS